MARGTACIYCGEPTSGVRKGDHIVPEALGGTLALKCVCKGCNGEFSLLEQDLCSRSPLSIAVQSELGTETTILWDYNPQLDLALEARYVPSLRATALWPQLLICGKKMYFQFDQAEADAVGLRDYCDSFHALLQRSIESWSERRKRPALRWERMVRLPNRGKYPPRIFTPHVHAEWRRGMTFAFRYYGDVDQGELVAAARTWKPILSRSTVGTNLGVFDPQVMMSYQPEFVLRSLVKIGINILAYVLSPELVNRDRFPIATRYARWGGDTLPNPLRNGFVYGKDLAGLECPKGSHVLELSHSGDAWQMFAIFFGGLIGTFVTFPGPPATEFGRVEVVVPVNSRDWTITRSCISVPRRPRVLWDNIAAMMPTLPARHGGSTTRVERRRGKRT